MNHLGNSDQGYVGTDSTTAQQNNGHKTVGLDGGETTQPGKGAANRYIWTVPDTPSAACGLRCAQFGARPLVYVYRFLDTVHRQLLALPSSEPFFDIRHPHSQFLSEFVFHRSLLASPFVTADARRASFFFVPFYSRLAHSNRSVKAVLLRRLHDGLQASPQSMASHGIAWHRMASHRIASHRIASHRIASHS